MVEVETTAKCLPRHLSTALAALNLSEGMRRQLGDGVVEVHEVRSAIEGMSTMGRLIEPAEIADAFSAWMAFGVLDSAGLTPPPSLPQASTKRRSRERRRSS